MIPKFRAWNNYHDEMILWDELLCEPYNRMEDFNDGTLEFMQSTGLHDKHGVEIFEGDIIQEVHAYDYATLEIETDYLEAFEVKKGNYVQGKWISKKIDIEQFSVIGYVFGKNVKVIGNVHQTPELLEDV